MTADEELALVSRLRRNCGHPGEDGVHFLPIHPSSALRDGRTVGPAIERGGKRGGDNGIHGRVLASG